MDTASEDALELSLGLSVGGSYRKRKTEDSSGGPIRPISRSDFSSPEENGGGFFAGCEKRGEEEIRDFPFPKRKQPRIGDDNVIASSLFPSSGNNADNSLHTGGTSITIENGISSGSVAMANPDDSSKNPIRKSTEKCSPSTASSSSITDPSASPPSSRTAPPNEIKTKPPIAAPPSNGRSARFMPRVLTTGNGPSGKTVRGFLYKYSVEEVSIICLCHGRSFSPASFVEHAGGVDIDNPLRHITVVRSSER